MTLALSATAADGRIPIGTVPYTISAAGSYYLTANLTNSASGSAITIASSNVTLDLCGHALRTTTANANIISSGYTNIRICNGMLLGGNYSLYIDAASAGFIAVDGVSVAGFTSTGISISGASYFPEVQITNNRITSNTGTIGTYGLSLTKVWGGQVTHNVLVGGGTAGYDQLVLQTAYDLLIADNSITYGYNGINVISSSSLRITRNNCSGCGGAGLLLQSACTNIAIEENLFSANGTYGLQVTAGVASIVYRNNQATNNSSGAYAATLCTNAGGNY